jgi:hypothetical protein
MGVGFGATCVTHRPQAHWQLGADSGRWLGTAIGLPFTGDSPKPPRSDRYYRPGSSISRPGRTHSSHFAITNRQQTRYRSQQA